MEIARIFFGLAAALCVPLGLGWQRKRPKLMIGFTLAYGIYAIAPYISEVRAWTALAVAVVTSLGLVGWARVPHTQPGNGSGAPTPGEDSESTPNTQSGDNPSPSPFNPSNWSTGQRAGAAALCVASALALWAAGATTKSLGTEFLSSDKASVFASGLLIAVFGGGLFAQFATNPVRKTIHALTPSPAREAALELMDGSRQIGIVERTLLYAFLAAGQPEAAALVLAAKSLARMHNAEHGKHISEYFLIGTLASVLAAVALSMAARSAVGLPAL
ncbi:hypothetical protein [Streptomyces toxytricini]|uniref:hypothetical protein n=1 Tax=Streptomyces toxytricini TaxID=67369 RepID=UPI00343B58B6